MVWAPPVPLAATPGIDVSFFSSGYLDVSVHRVPFHTLWIGVWIHEVCSCGFPHSEICGSMDICSSPQLFAAYHVFHRLLVPRHPPCALLRLTNLPDICGLQAPRLPPVRQLPPLPDPTCIALHVLAGSLFTFACFYDYPPIYVCIGICHMGSKDNHLGCLVDKF